MFEESMIPLVKEEGVFKGGMMPKWGIHRQPR
jgi:hypothetical protein